MDSVSDSKVDAVLDLARQLWDEREGIDVDLIDGVFYWRICRGELLTRLRALLREGRAYEDPSFERGGERLLDPQHQDHLRRTFDHLHAMSMEIPGLSGWIDDGKPARMRDALDLSRNSWLPLSFPVITRAGMSRDDLRNQTFRTVSIGVRNSRWLGKKVETVFREQLTDHPISTWDEVTVPDDRFDRMGVTFDLFPAGELQIPSEWPELPTGEDRHVYVPSPVIVCTSTFPLPPEGLIAQSYDLIARGQHRWHELLFGSGEEQRQGTDVAIRTWAIGLLQGLGLKRFDAEAMVFEAIGVEGRLSDPQYTQDRKNLVRRVPEAEQYVFRRNPKASH